MPVTDRFEFYFPQLTFDSLNRFMLGLWVMTVFVASLLDWFSFKSGFKFWKHFSISYNYAILTRPPDQNYPLLENARTVMILLELFIHSAIWAARLNAHTLWSTYEGHLFLHN